MNIDTLLPDDGCTHDSSTGVDQTTGPMKVWRCDWCGWLHRFELVGRGVYRMVAANREDA